MSESAWVLRCRGPQGAPATLDLPQGGATTVAEIAELAGKALRVARSRVVIKAGFPPKTLFCPESDAEAQGKTASEAGLSDREAVIIDRTPVRQCLRLSVGS
ncbi:hypothetical protein T484DRAFT_1958593 [Baffinella frigidus]|nr:hypothetical protein T484DRAFT_1958593 [Cryptophyta sp. CCMP2293]